MRNREWLDNRGIEAWRVVEKCGAVRHEWQKRLLWFLHAVSWQENGLLKLTEALLDMFPDRIIPKHHYCWSHPERSRDYTSEEMRNVALHGEDHGNKQEESISEFVQKLCTDPEMVFNRGDNYSVRDAKLSYFKEIVSALREVKNHREQAAVKEFYLTAIGKQMWEALDFGRANRKMVLLNGREGRGKSEAAKAYWAKNLDQVRYVSLEPDTNETLIFRAIADGLGLACGFNRTVPELKMRIKDTLKRSDLFLVIDEAHYAFQRCRNMTRPPGVIDWIDTALCNEAIGVGLITTPQFLERMGQAAVQVGWNSRQFERRISRLVTLPEKNTQTDIEGVIKTVFPKIDRVCAAEIYAYVIMSKRDLSAVGDLVTEVKHHCNTEKVTSRQIRQIIEEILTPGDLTIARAMKAAEIKYGQREKGHAGAAPVQFSEPPCRSVRPESLPQIERGTAPVSTEALSPV